MNRQVVLKSALITFCVVLLMPCRNLFAVSLWRMERLCDNWNDIPDNVLLIACLDNLAFAICSLLMTGLVLAGAIVGWRFVERPK